MTTILRIEWRWKLKPQSQGKCVHLSSVNRWSLCQYLIFKSQDLWNCHRTLSLSIINNYTIIVKSKGNVKYFKWPISNYTIIVKSKGNVKYFKWPIRKTKHHIFSRCPISSYPISFPGLGSETRARLFGEKDAAEQVNTKLESPGWKKTRQFPEGRVRLPNQMNFRKNSKRPSKHHRFLNRVFVRGNRPKMSLKYTIFKVCPKLACKWYSSEKEF